MRRRLPLPAPQSDNMLPVLLPFLVQEHNKPVVLHLGFIPNGVGCSGGRVGEVALPHFQALFSPPALQEEPIACVVDGHTEFTGPLTEKSMAHDLATLRRHQYEKWGYRVWGHDGDYPEGHVPRSRNWQKKMSHFNASDTQTGMPGDISIRRADGTFSHAYDMTAARVAGDKVNAAIKKALQHNLERYTIVTLNEPHKDFSRIIGGSCVEVMSLDQFMDCHLPRDFRVPRILDALSRLRVKLDTDPQHHKLRGTWNSAMEEAGAPD